MSAKVAPDEPHKGRYLDRGRTRSDTSTESTTHNEPEPLAQKRSVLFTPSATVLHSSGKLSMQIARTDSISSMSSNNRWVTDGEASPSRGLELKVLVDMSPHERSLVRGAQKLSARRIARREGSFSSFSNSSRSTENSSKTGSTGVQRMPSLKKIASSGLVRPVIIFSAAIFSKLRTSLYKNKKVAAQITRLWRECVVNVFLHKGTWTLGDYMNYHLSLYCFLEPLDNEGQTPLDAYADLADVAWDTAIDDWDSDTQGRKTLDFNTFFDSVFELATCYADDRTAASFIRFLKELHRGVTVENKEAPSDRTWRFKHPATNDAHGCRAAVDTLRALVCKLSMAAHPGVDPHGAVTAWLSVHGGRPLTYGPEEGASMISVPMDLMAALVNAAVEAKRDGDHKSEQQAQQVLSWVSSSEHYECSDDASRGRLVSLYRALDAGMDGRISALDVLSGGGAGERHGGASADFNHKMRRAVRGAGLLGQLSALKRSLSLKKASAN